MDQERRKQLVEFSESDVLAALRANAEALSADVERCRKDTTEQVIVLDWNRSVDREDLHKHRSLVRSLLLHNSSGICRKLVVRKGCAAWDRERCSNCLSKGPMRLDTFAMSICALCSMVGHVKRNMTIGARTPTWLQERRVVG